MPRPKKTTSDALTPAPKKITLTQEQFEKLQAISEMIGDARNVLCHFEPENLAGAGYQVGKSYVHLDKAEDELTDLINDIDPGYDY